MREYSTVRADDPRLAGNLTDVVVSNARDHPLSVAFRVRHGAEWTDRTTVEFHADVVAVAKGLVALGVTPEERVGLLMSTRYEWAVLDFALWWVGAVSVPLYTTSGDEQVRAVLADAGAETLLVETASQSALAAAARASLPDLQRVWSMDVGGLDDLRANGVAVSDAELEARRTSTTRESVASLVYTSGTTGEPRGCVLTHANFLEECVAALLVLHELFDSGEAATLMFLPLAHIFARTVQVAAVISRVTLGHTPHVARLFDDLASFRPTFLLAVPRIFEQLYNTASQQAAADGWGRRFGQASAVAIAYSRAVDSGGPGRLLRARHALFERRVYPQLRESLGGRCTHGVCGGAPLGDRLAHFYRGIGVPMLEGYGLTETTAAVTVNSPSDVRLGSVGQPVPGTSVRVSEDGELLLRGGQVMRGYWQAPEATAHAFDEQGWLHTGDVGEIDSEGFVWVTGRKQEILVTAGGKYVAPEPIEERIRAHPLVSQCMVVGDGRPYLAALITLDPQVARAWSLEHGAREQDLPQDPLLLAAVQSAVDDANASVSQAESVRRFVVMEEEWTEESGQLTASLKPRRRVIVRRHRDEVEDLFST